MPGIIDSERGYCAMGGALRYNDDFFFVTLFINGARRKFFSTMIGGACLRDHKLYKGKHFAAGKVSYIILNSGKKLDDENLLGRSFGIPKFLQRYSQVKKMDIETVDLLTIFAAVQKEEPEAVACLRWYTEEIAARIFNIQTVLDVKKFSIGGEPAKYPAFIENLRDNLEKFYAECSFNLPQAQVVTSKFYSDANLIGALQCWLTKNF